MVRHIVEHQQPYPLIVHFHAVAFVGWLVLLTVQVLLVRAHRTDLHRKLGMAGALLAGVMLILGPATAVIVQRSQFGHPNDDLPFLSVQLADIVAFAGLIGSALWLRKQPAAHKRLVLLATLYIADAGFSRWLWPSMHDLMGDAFWGQMAQDYVGNDLQPLAQHLIGL